MILNVSNLYKTYTRRGEEFNAVEDVEFFAWSGDFSVIFGESGSGKSTLLSLLSGINRPTQGSIVFNGADFANLTDAEISKVRNDKIGYIPQESVFLPHFTVLENILLPRALRDGKNIEVKNLTDSVDDDIVSAQDVRLGKRDERGAVFCHIAVKKLNAHYKYSAKMSKFVKLEK